ncbi:2-amino-5-formylamino-6-ribosylaminopyrimidin-4(3H)-one 5'-monophosphate deformylase [uncultured archaeon]|nr:2-amino-5-formylamino-6-ribosylaminopyrimidin-4(3H)-one 5'-monophosphate deformylase [uncultured archaeon]
MKVRDLSNSIILNEIKKKPIAIIPIGSIEQHGPHLPVSTDSDIISHIAKKVSEKTGFLLLPTIEYGVSFEHHPFFNMSLSSSTLARVLMDLCVSLSRNKITGILILNGHHGNHKTVKKIPSKVSRLPGFKAKILVYSYWHFMKRKLDHAGFVETSIMRAISKKVEMDKAVRGLIPDDLPKEKRVKLDKLASKSFISATKNGIWGDPTNASAKVGKEILEEVITSIVKESQTCLTGKTRKLHQ